MKCHYEILGLPLNCTSDELKKAYRKLALEWHPDKNLDRLEEAKESFQLIQQAYEILSDPQERAWYDRHRDDILQGDLDSSYKDDCLNVFQYYNSSCFKGYNDDEKGFYTVYRNVFNQINAEDKPFMDEDIDVPEFGMSNSSYEDVVHNFYAYWQSYCTPKSYSWVDKFDLSESRKSGVGRQVIRLMEKENKKLRDQHKKIRNEEIRQLVSFVRKRDKRVKAQKKIMEEERAEKAKRMEENRRKQIHERNKTLENYQESEWSSMSQFENHFNEIEAHLDDAFGKSDDAAGSEEEEEELTDLYCVACDKDFRSPKAMENHENSRKHMENVALLKSVMQEEELQNESKEILNSTEVEQANGVAEDLTCDAMLENLISSSTKSKKKKKKSSKIDSEQKDIEENICDIDDKLNQIQVSKKETSCEELLVSGDKDDGEKNPQISKKKPKKLKPPKSTPAPESTDANMESNEEPTTICDTCKSDFNSRNKLFEHLKKTGHAKYKDVKGQSSDRAVKKSKKGRR